MDTNNLAVELLATFVDELETHVAALNRDLLMLEHGEPADRAEEVLHSLFRTAHTIKGASRAAGATLIERASHGIEELLSMLREKRLSLDPALFELFFGVTDAIAEAGERLRKSRELAGAPLEGFLERLAAAANEGRVGDPVKDVVSAPAPSLIATVASVRIDPERLDELIARSSELLVAIGGLEERSQQLSSLGTLLSATLGEARSRKGGAIDGRSVVVALDRFAAAYEGSHRRLAIEVGHLDVAIKRLRMVRFVDGCQGLDRVVRDLAATESKPIALVVHGGDIELDRAVLEGLRAPLLHLVRNAVDHGIEPPAERAARGKPAGATVTISASLRGSEIVVTVQDDGRGVNLDAVREQLHRRKLPEPAGDENLARAVFLPGFSTSRLITDVSGRGVGLDVVKRAVEALRGSVDLSFRAGEWTRFELAVPLTLTSLRALLVRAGNSTYAIPSSFVTRLLRVDESALRAVGGTQTVTAFGVTVPVVALTEVIGVTTGQEPSKGKVAIVVLRAQGYDVGFGVDELLEEREVVAKSLGTRLSAAKAVSGATVLPSGRLALILNTPELVRRARDKPGTTKLLLSREEGSIECERRVLLADDSVTTRTLERSILEAAGYTVLVAVDGSDAWRILQEKGADLVVSDVEMPHMDGFALTETIRGSTRFRSLPIVLVTALASDVDKERGLAAGANAYLIKGSFDQTNLLETIAQLL